MASPTDIVVVSGGQIREAAPPDAIVATLGAADTDAGDTFTFTIVNDASGFFEIVGNTIRVKVGANIDFEAAQQHIVRVRVTDSINNTYEEDVTISVLNGNEIPGTGAGETINGTVGDDIIDALGGNDIVDGQAGNDTIYGGAGSDNLSGGFGDDYIEGGTENDTIVGGAGADTILGGEGNDFLYSVGGGGKLDGGEGNDYLEASTSSNQLSETLIGGGGDDRIYYAGWNNRADIVDAGSGNDYIGLAGFKSAGFATTVTLGAGQDTLAFEGTSTVSVTHNATITDFTPGAGGDRIDLSTILNTLTGFSGQNPFGASGYLILVQDGPDTLLQMDQNGATGGPNYTTILKFLNTNKTSFTADNFLPGYPPDGTAPEGQEIDGTGAGETINGTVGDDIIDALGGNDIVDGQAGNDTIYGGAGSDNLSGGFGDDYIEGGTENDTIVGGAGADTILGGEGNDFLYSVGGGGKLDGGEGNDYLEASTSSNQLSETLIGGGGDDRIDYAGWNNRADIVDAGSGNDYIGLAGFKSAGFATTVTLGAGQDTLAFEGTSTVSVTHNATITDFTPGAGGDRIDLSTILNTLTGFSGQNPFGASGYLILVQDGPDTLLQMDQNGATGGPNYTTILKFLNTNKTSFTADNFLPGYPPDGTAPEGQEIDGTGAGETINGTVGDDIIDALGGNDIVDGQAGNDTIYGGAGSDNLSGGFGDDYIEGGTENDTIVGGAGADTILGGEGNDFLYSVGGGGKLDGGEGNDYLEASTSSNQLSETLIGGGGDDRIYYAGWNNRADIVDAGSGNDYIGLAGFKSAGFATTVTLGAGQDTLAFEGTSTVSVTHNATITDFTPGAGGDRIDLSTILNTLTGFSGQNPFGASGYLILVQDGPDTLLQMDQNGATGGPNYTTILKFLNTNKTSFTNQNFIPSFAPDGSAAPSATITPTSYAATEQTTLNLKNTGLSLSDADSVNLTATLSVGEGVLNVTAGTSGASVGGSGTSTVIITGTIAQITALLNSDPTSTVSYINNGDAPAASTTFSFTVSDGVSTTVDTAAINATPVNDPPVNTVPGAQTIAEDGVVQFSVAGGNAISVADVDSPSLAVTLSAPAGTIVVANTAGLSSATGNGTNSVVLSGSAAALNAALDNLRYHPAADFAGNVTLSVSTSDGALVDNDTISINVTAVNDTPVLDLNGAAGGTSATLNYTENQAATQIAPSATVTDVDSANFDGGILNVGFAANGTAADQLALHNQGTGAGQIGVSGNTVTYAGVSIGTFVGGANGGNLVVTFNANATATAVQALVARIQYSNTSDAPSVASRNVSFVLTDGDGGSTNVAATINVAAVADAPVAASNGGSLAYTENGAASPINAVLTLADVDSANLVGATVAITANLAAGQDVLGFTNQNGITGSYDAGAGILTLTGTATLAQYQAALRSVTYVNTSDTPSPLQRTVSFQVNDGSLASNVVTSPVTIAAVNDVPVVTNFGPAVTATEQTTIILDGDVLASDLELNAGNGGAGNYAGASFSVLRNGGFNPQDAFGLASTGTLYTLSGGKLQWAGLNFGDVVVDPNGLLFVAFTSENTPATSALVNDVLRHITYTNLSDTPPASIQATLIFRDGNAGAQGTGGLGFTGPVKTVTLTAVNDAPVVSGNGGGLAYTENGAAAAVNAVLTLSDVDSTSLTGATVAISGNFAAGQDVLGFVNQSGITGSYNAATGVLTLTGSAMLAQYQAALRSVSYANTSDTPSALQRTVSFQVDDGSLLSNVAASAVNVTAVNDAPVAGTVETGINEDQVVTLQSFFFGYSDAEGAPLAGVRIESLPTDGQLFFDATGGSRIDAVLVTGGQFITRADIDAGKLFFIPGEDETGVPYASFTYRVSDGALELTSLGTHSFNVFPINDAPTTSPVTLAAILEDSGPRLITQAQLLANASDVEGNSLQAVNLGIQTGAGNLVSNGDGTWTYTPAQNDDTGVTFSYAVTDGFDATAASASLDITSINDAPVLNPPFNFTIQENSSLPVGTISAFDPEGAPLTFTMLSGFFDAAHFSVNSATGELRFLAPPNFEQPADSYSGVGATAFDNSYVVPVVVGDGVNTIQTTWLVNVTNVNEAPAVALTNAIVSLPEHGSSATRIKVANIVITDDALGTETLGLSGLDAASFEISGSELFLKAAVALDFEQKGSYSVAVTVDDTSIPGAPDATSATYTLLVGDVNPDIVTGTAGNNVFFGGASDDQLLGLGGNDTLNGGGGKDLLDGGSGSDRMTGGLGDDIFIVDNLGDVVTEAGGQGTDTVRTSVSDFVLSANVENIELLGTANLNATGSVDANTITGNTGQNTLNGGLGNDVLIGKGGKDLLTGSGGLDSIVLTSLSDSGVTFAARDVITTFAHGDKIDVSAIDAKTTLAGDQAFTFVSAFTGVAGQLQWDLTNVSATGVKGYLVQGDINGDSSADFSLQIYTAPTQSLPGGPEAWNLASWDFIL